MAGRRLAVVMLGTDTWAQLRTEADVIADALVALRPGDVVEVDPGPGRGSRDGCSQAGGQVRFDRRTASVLA